MSSETNSILLVGSPVETSIEQMYKRAFQANSYFNIDLVDIEANLQLWMQNRVLNRLIPGLRNKYASDELVKHLRISKNKYTYIILFKGMQFKRQILDECRRLSPSAIWININPDDPWNNSSRAATNANVINSLTFFDVYCTWSLSLVKKLQGSGCKKVVYLPFGYDEVTHVPSKLSTANKSKGLSFIGSWDQEREYLLTQLEGINIDVKIYGNSWARAARSFPFKNNISHGSVFGEDMATIISSSDICLNPMRTQNKGSHNMRTFETPAMGGLLLTVRTQEQQVFFPENEACYMYSDIEELKKKIEHIVENKEEANKVRIRGMELVVDHSYTNRVKNLLKELAD
jgi:spore maturation protein CgeB